MSRNFVCITPEQLVESTKAQNTTKKTASDVKLFMEFLVQIRGISSLPEEIDETQLISLISFLKYNSLPLS